MQKRLVLDMFELSDNQATAVLLHAPFRQVPVMAEKFASGPTSFRCPCAVSVAGGWERSPADALVSLLLIAAIVPSLLLGTVLLRGAIGLRQVLGVR